MVTKSTRTAAQSDAVNAARAARAAHKATIVDVPFVESEQPQAASPESMFKLDWKTLFIGEASWKRAAVAAVASLATSAVVGYFGGHLLGYLTLGATLLTGSMFVALLVYVLGILLIMYVGYRVSAFTYLKVIDKTVDRKCSAAYGWVTGLFTSKEVTA